MIRLVAPLSALALFACSGQSGHPPGWTPPPDETSVSSVGVDGGAQTFGACAWPADLNPPSAGGWTIARALLYCRWDGGAEQCLSNDPPNCLPPLGNVVPNAPCVAVCASDEYAVAYGGGAPGAVEQPTPNLPSTCRDPSGGLTSYSGGVMVCCPCE